jgi:hypothetical protein
MAILWYVLGALVPIGLVLLFARRIDRARGVDSSDKWAGWYRSKTPDISQTQGVKASEYDSMDDHGNRDLDGGL